MRILTRFCYDKVERYEDAPDYGAIEACLESLRIARPPVPGLTFEREIYGYVFRGKPCIDDLAVIPASVFPIASVSCVEPQAEQPAEQAVRGPISIVMECVMGHAFVQCWIQAAH